MVAAANPISLNPIGRGFMPFGYSDFLSGFTWTVVLNYLPNLFLFSMMFSLAVRLFEEVAQVPVSRKAFFGCLFLTILVISVIGSLIDMTLLMEFVPAHGEYRLAFNLLNWSTAAVLIFISIVWSGILILKIRPKPIIGIAFGIALFNFIFWLLISVHGETVSILGILASIVLLIFPLKDLFYWHKEQLEIPAED